MKSSIYFFWIYLFAVISVFGQDTTGLQLAADYPFATNADEQTGNYQPATTHNATYSGNAVYSNGIYQGSGNTNYCLIKTDDIQELLGDKFIIKLDVKIEENNKPIFVIGDSYRWLTVDIFNNELRVLTYETGNNYGQYNSGFTAQLNTWYSLAVVYEATTRKLEFYVNNVKMIDTTIPTELDRHNETALMNTHYGSGKTFKGYWKNLKIYGHLANFENILHHDIFKIYPNPTKNNLNISFTNKTGNTIQITDTHGKILINKTVNNDDKQNIDISGLTPGLYFVKYKIQNNIYIQKLLIE